MVMVVNTTLLNMLKPTELHVLKRCELYLNLKGKEITEATG